MSDVVFDTLTDDEWTESGAGNSAEKGEYKRILESFVGAGVKFARIPMDSGRFAGRKASSVTTSLKSARDGKDAPEGSGTVEIKSKKNAVYLHNTAVA